MEIRHIDVEQGSPEWYAARVGIVTASSLKHVLAEGEGKTRTEYMRQLAGEIVTGRPMDSYSNAHMQRGKEEEAPARDLLELRLGQQVRPTGFIRNDTLRLGCSPDGLVGEDEGAEIKTCLAHLQVSRLLIGGVPSIYKAQVEGSILASGKSAWHFFSHAPGMPPLLVKVTLTDERRREIETKLAAFNTELDALVTKIKGMF